MNIEKDKSKHLLFDIEESQGPVLIMYSLNRDKEYSQVLHILRPNPSKSQFRLGRSHEADVKINDNSVSRFHSHILLTSKGFVLEDNLSKFGTLVLLHGKQELAPETGFSVQIKRTVITFAVKEEGDIPLPSEQIIVPFVPLIA